MDFEAKYAALVKKLRDVKIRQAFMECGGGDREIDFQDFEAAIGKEFDYNPDTDRITRKGQLCDFAAEIKFEVEQAKRDGRKVLPALFDGELGAIASETAKLHQSQFNEFLANPKKFGIDATSEQVPMLVKTGRVQFAQLEGED